MEADFLTILTRIDKRLEAVEMRLGTLETDVGQLREGVQQTQRDMADLRTEMRQQVQAVTENANEAMWVARAHAAYGPTIPRVQPYLRSGGLSLDGRDIRGRAQSEYLEDE